MQQQPRYRNTRRTAAAAAIPTPDGAPEHLGRFTDFCFVAKQQLFTRRPLCRADVNVGRGPRALTCFLVERLLRVDGSCHTRKPHASTRFSREIITTSSPQYVE